MKKKVFALLLTVLFAVALIGCGNQENASKQKNKKEEIELKVSAAASLTDAMSDLQKAFQKEYSGVKFTNNFGSSGTLAQQIEQGAPADIFLSADQKWMDALAEKKMIAEDTRKDFSGNKIVLIAGKGSDIKIDSFEKLTDKIGQIAIGDPESVPAGSYTKEALEKIGKWKKLEKHFVYGSDVAQTLKYVESGNTDIGFVYSSDALLSDKVKVLAEADPTWHKSIVYPGAVLKDTKNFDEAKAFIEFLNTDEAQKILRNYGFSK
ncbi:molybdate ABC transporter substrate-binding protein [Niallia sp. NCCP-28]|uniref:molybdate ABC transporter substrate-binding protein n=1 Tax=Niallia sp. NCCP-28 TaxID=2934712 RepID=UPI00208B3587|nr:molybdate ABC transporter substrate-binding protein [Niallia sp. NCCP-28]GKU84582.1 molybdate ABC transporter substrate-binding protein [Niallia sp. NCCP-28]